MRSINTIGRIPVKIVLICIILIGVALRFYHLGNESIWFDEAFTLIVAHKPLDEIVNTIITAGDNIPPLYHIFMHFWILGAKSDFYIRIPSAIFSILAIYFVFTLGRSLFNPQLGLLGALLIALAPSQIQYAQEARPYSLASLLTLVSFYYFYNLLSHANWKSWVVYVLATILSFYSHIFTALNIITQNLFLFIFRKKYPFLLTKWIICQAIILLFISPWIPVIFLQVARIKAQFWLPHLSLLEPIKVLVFLGTGTHFNLNPTLFIPLNLPFIFLFCLAFKNIRTREYLLLFIWFFLPLIVVYICSLMLEQSIFYKKYFIFIAPAYYLAIAASLVKIINKNTILIPSAFILIVINIGSFYYNLIVPWKIQPKLPVKELSHYISNHYQPGDIIIHTNPTPYFTFFPAIYYHNHRFPEYILSPSQVPWHGGKSLIEDKDKLEDLSELGGNIRRVWVIRVYKFSPSQGHTPYTLIGHQKETNLLTMLKENQFFLTECKEFTGLKLCLYEKK